MAKLKIKLSSTAPTGLPPPVHTALNDVHIQLNSVIHQLNRNDGVFQSPNGHYWRVAVSDTGTLATTDLGTVLP